VVALAVPATAQQISQLNLEQGPGLLEAGEGLAQAPYEVVDNIEGPWINLNVVPIRPMVQTASHAHIYALNTNASTVQHYENFVGPPTDTFRVPWGPVSIAIWPDFAETELLVVCRGSHVLARLDRATGETLSVLDLPFEPADIVVDHTRNRAFISCSGDDSVVEVDLIANEIVATYRIPSKHPVFLSFDANGTDVLVAPMFSGNNSTVLKNAFSNQALSNVVDMDTSPLAVEGLPDQDLFRIDPIGGTVSPILKGTGTVLFAHGINPSTGEFWQLNTEANNKNPNKQTEADIRGIAVQNRLTITTLPAPGGGVNDLHLNVLDLDDSDAVTVGTQHDPLRSIGQPYSLEFDANGNALVAGLLTDNVTAFSSTGVFITEVDLAAGSIPRQTLLWNPTTVLVYCWGTSRVEVWNLGGVWTLLAALDLGFDPTPQLVRDGRKVFYDASHSQHNNQSCASCHVEGRTDMAVWNLSDALLDNKGPTVTQTLAGIDKSPPFHWRGERPSLSDFNPAFPSTLGGTPLDMTPGGEFDQFQAFVFSIQATANPNQHPRRLVSDAYGVTPPDGMPRGSAVRGQQLFLEAPIDGGLTCNFCHTLPTGTSNDTTADAPADPRPRRTSFETTAFTELWRKDQPTDSVEFSGGVQRTYAVLGAGLTHAGLSNSVLDFIDDNFQATAQEVMDLTSFVHTIDQGVAPYIHHAEILNSSTVNRSLLSLTLLMEQAEQRNIDIAVYGTVDLGSGARSLAWYWNRQTERFHPEDSTVPTRALRFFMNQARAGTGNVVFVGLPVGMGRPWGTDFDDDQLLNLDEAQQGTSPIDPDSDDDGQPDGQEVLFGGNPTNDQLQSFDPHPPVISNVHLKWVTAKVAKIAWETDEPTTFTLDYFTTFGPSRRVTGDVPKIVHSAIISDLLPSTMPGGPIFTYLGTLSCFDLEGNKTDTAMPPFSTRPFFELAGEAVLANLNWTQLLHDTQPVAGFAPIEIQRLNSRAEVRVERKVGGPPRSPMEDYVVVATVHVNGVKSNNFTSQNPTSFTVLGQSPVLQGPFVISNPTGMNGIAQLRFIQPGLSAGDQVRLHIEAVVPINPLLYSPSSPDFGDPSDQLPLSRWDFPATPASARSITTTY
jgi:hypothetical protein